MEVYGAWDFQAPEFIEPKEESLVDTAKLQHEYEEKVKKFEEELEKARQKAETENEGAKSERKRKSKRDYYLGNNLIILEINHMNLI